MKRLRDTIKENLKNRHICDRITFEKGITNELNNTMSEKTGNTINN